jgi:hypothetical protein
MAEKKSIPGVCFPWEEKKKEYEEIKGDEKIVKEWWEQFDTLAYLFMWFMVISA